ncbi:putative disease resistance protein RGA1 [Prunus yedoensis var. nudiflora]|uniref:Putative disease resistance protein RGA1 n=1 Tax=Prunus yedoensis var. nudiflora TaxID=2094558 RepID=A0A314ZL40_PRUYE|nr:putative disease resistance protein RGA1 [Prunus yedoensis var. nudiflora]
MPLHMQNLSSLKSLTIVGVKSCPLGHKLEERCRRGSGEDWSKIAHVPHKYIRSPQVRQSGEVSTVRQERCRRGRLGPEALRQTLLAKLCSLPFLPDYAHFARLPDLRQSNVLMRDMGYFRPNLTITASASFLKLRAFLNREVLEFSEKLETR